MSGNRKAIKIMGIFVLGFILIYAALQMYQVNQTDESSVRVQFYFLNPAASRLDVEEQTVSGENNRELLEQVLQQLYEGPRNKNLTKLATVPWMEAKIAEKVMDNNYNLEIEFSEEYYQLSASDEQFFRASLVWTMTSLPFIDNVHIYVSGMELLNSSGEPMGLLNRENVFINPTIPPTKSEVQVVTLYFTDEQSRMLVPEIRAINVNPDQPLEKYILEQLIAGPEEAGHLQLIPPDTKVREIRRDEAVCYVNFSSEFVSRHSGGANLERMTIYAIVNSLTELSDVKRVQILVEGVKYETYKGNLDISRPLERDESLIIMTEGEEEEEGVHS